MKNFEKILMWKKFQKFGVKFWIFLGVKNFGKFGCFFGVRNWKIFGVVVNGLWASWGGVGGVTDFCIFGVFWSFEFFGGV